MVTGDKRGGDGRERKEEGTILKDHHPTDFISDRGYTSQSEENE